jgi:hypothetical protein
MMKSWKECRVCGEFLSYGPERQVVCANGCFEIKATKLNDLNSLLDQLYVHFPISEGICSGCKGPTEGHRFCDECYDEHVLV